MVLKAKSHSAKVMDYEGVKTLLRRADTQFPRLCHLWLEAGYRGEDKGKDWVEKTYWVERRSCGASPKARSQGGVDEVGQGMGQGRRGRGLAETIAPKRLRGIAEKVGSGADVFVDRPQPEDEQRLLEVMCERRSVGICCHDSPHDEAPCPHLRPFHTVSPRTRVYKG